MARGAVPVEVAPNRPLRADARRNRERILRAARAVFADQGTDAQIDDVARRAKVGVGTVYRHFPTKDALLDALVRERFAAINALADEALARDDAWEAFREFVWRSAELNANDLGFCDAVAHHDQTALVIECGLMARAEELMRRAQAQGAMRADATAFDVSLTMCALGSVIRTIPGPDAWRRYLALMLDGLRAS